MHIQAKDIIEETHQNLRKSYAPYSNFNVSCGIITKNGKVYYGVNVENSSFGMSVCAESAAICQMVLDGETEIQTLIVMASSEQLCSPCGACRQRISEFADASAEILMCNKEGILKKATIDELFPLAFNLKRHSTGTPDE